jgi:hypothetical protein
MVEFWEIHQMKISNVDLFRDQTIIDRTNAISKLKEAPRLGPNLRKSQGNPKSQR